jgi:hypothetical protein
VEDFLAAYPALNASQVSFIKRFTGSEQPPTDGGNTHVAFLSAVKDPAAPDTLFVGYEDFLSAAPRYALYRLDTASGLAEAAFEVPSQSNYNLEGIRGRKLVLFWKESMDSPGPCSNDWVMAYEAEKSEYRSTRTMQALNLDDIPAGLEKFEIPEDKYQAEKKISDQCMAEFTAEMDNRD